MSFLKPRRPLALFAAYALLALTWAMTNAPFAAPDEAEHYIRAVGVSEGSLLGRRARDPNPSLTAKERAWTDQASRAVMLPAGLSPAGLDCVIGKPHVSASCQTSVPPPAAQVGVSSVGTYQPLPYLLPALALRASNHAPGAGRLARLAGLVPWLVLLAGAVAALWDRGRGAASLSGLMLGITPMVIFVGASLTGSGLEIMGSLAFTAALLRLGRAPRAPVWVWGLIGVAGVLLTLSRTLGPGWVALDAGVWVLYTGAGQTMAILRSRPRAAGLVGACVLIAMALNRVWEGMYGPHVTTSVFPPASYVRGGLNQFAGSLPDLVGQFGYLEFGVPVWLVLAWGLAAVGAATVAIRAASARPRRAIIAAIVLCVVAPIYLFAAVTSNTGFGLQGRHYQALVVMVALLIGEVLGRSRTGWRWATALSVLAGVGQLVAWWVNARRYAVGDRGSWWFLSSPQWSPPLGWGPWALVALVAGTMLVWAGVERRRLTTSWAES